MTKKIFNEQGFLTKEGKAFLDDGFVKEMRRVFATATEPCDVLTISCLLKKLVGDASCDIMQGTSR